MQHRVWTKERLCALGLLVGGLALAGCASDVGASAEPIVNGRAASDGERYGTVAIPIGGIGGPGELDNCTGTLIRPNVVLTAAHCFFESDEFGDPTSRLEAVDRFQVVAGPLSVFGASGDEIYGVERFVVHPGYDNLADSGDIGPSVNDVALIVTDRDVTQVDVIPLLEADRRSGLEGMGLTISGYGADRLDGAGEPAGGGQLMVADVMVDITSATEFLAYDDSGMDTCPGDSGGPAYLLTDGEARLLGVTSRADPMAEAQCGDGGIYSTAHAFEAWIDQEVGPLETGGCSVGARPASSGPAAVFAVFLAALGLIRRRR